MRLVAVHFCDLMSDLNNPLPETITQLIVALSQPEQMSKALPRLADDDPWRPLYEAVLTAVNGLQEKILFAENKWLATQEKLGETHLDFILARQEADKRLRETENLLEGLRGITESLGSGETFARMLAVLRGVLSFEQAFVLTASSHDPHQLEVLASTDPVFENTQWMPLTFFKRVLATKTTAVFDIGFVPEWQVQPPSVREKVVSALHTPLRKGKGQGAVLVCTHSQKGFFTQTHIELAERFSLLAAQALMNAELYIAVRQERDSLEEQVQIRTQDLAYARDRALEASRLKTQLLANVSHELRTPLNAIMGYAEMIQEGIHGPLLAEQQAVIERISVNGRTLLARINDLIDQAQIESGQLIFHIAQFTPIELLENVQATVGGLAEAKGLELITELHPQMPLLLFGDQERLQQILTNLTTNAIKFTTEGRVWVRIYRQDPTHWCLSVQDTGSGIEKANLDYIFDPFRQVDSSRTRLYAGFGLGLSIVKQLVTLMHGQILVESEHGKGSTFTVVLPLEIVKEY